MTYIPAPPNTNLIPICGYVSTNQKRDAACAYDPSAYEQGVYKPLPNDEPGAYEPATSSSSISLPQTSTSSVAATKATKAASDPFASPHTNIQYTNSTVQTGNLFGPAINKFIVSGIEGNCPPTPDGVFESCNGGKPFSKDVEFMIAGDGNYIIQEASVSFGIPLSNYSSTANRDGMIAVLGAFLENMATNGTANCQTNTSEWEDDDCEPGEKKEKRDSGPSGSPGSEPGSKCMRVVSMTYCQVPGIVQLEITENNEVTEYMVSGDFLFLLCRRVIV